jgi:pimeloyl-ACP methyl ester carboxylesterase
VLLFCGSRGGKQIRKPGPKCPGQVPAWKDNPHGYDTHPVQYPGSKYQQAQDAAALNLPDNIPLILVCYSAGTEACLMYANDRLNNGGSVQSIVLLGPTFTGANTLGGSSIGFNSPNGGWAAYMDNILENGTDIVVVDDIDGGPEDYISRYNSHTDAWGYTAPANAAGNFSYIVSGTKHVTSLPSWISGTQFNVSLRNYVYDVVDALAATK